jgi:hydroxymethylglutaryl-CoA lyase
VEKLKIVECPRDAMQGLVDFIPTETKIEYLKTLLQVGFDTLDFGSFVSPKAIPQLRDTAEVLEGISHVKSNTQLLAIIANTRGAEDACRYQNIRYLGFPLSISETFQQRNTNKSINEAMVQLQEIQDLCIKFDKKLVTYISMGFGNPYGDPYNKGIVLEFSERLKNMGVGIISLADTIGAADNETIRFLFETLIPAYPDVEFGAHLHANPAFAMQRIKAAYEAGCRRFDGAIRGFGGCPMAKDDLVGNMDTATILQFAKERNLETGVNEEYFQDAYEMALKVFPH